MQQFAPLVENNAADAPEADEARLAGLRVLLPKNINFAKNDSLVDEDCTATQWVERHLIQALIRARANRYALEDEWLAIQRLSELVHDQGQSYTGRSNAYLPIYAQASDTQVTALSRGLFPSDDYMDVWDRDRGVVPAAAACKAYMQYELDCSARIRNFIKPALKQFVDFGNCCLKYWWRKELRSLGRVRKDLVGLENAPYQGLTVSARNMFNVYVYPETAEGLRDALWVAERTKVSKVYVQEMGRKERWANVEEALASASPNFIDGKALEINSLQDKNQLGTVSNDMDSNPLLRMYTAWEVWTQMPLPKEAYVEGEEPGTPVSVRVVIIGGTVCYIGRNPYFHQMPPYLFGRQRVIPGVFYGSGAGRNGRYLQYLANDFANQMNDVGTFTMNPIGIVNPTLMAGPLPAFAPRAMVKARDIDKAFKFERPPADLIQYGQQLMSTMISMLPAPRPCSTGGAPVPSCNIEIMVDMSCWPY